MTDVPSTAGSPTKRRTSSLAIPSAGTLRDYGILVTFVVLFVALSVTTPAFLTQQNLLNIVFQTAPLAIAACGVTIVIISGGFDLSIGAVFAFAGVIAAYVAVHVDPVLGLIAGLLVGPIIGAINGIAILVLRIHSFLATLAMSLMVRALGVMITGGFLLAVDDNAFLELGNGRVLGIRTPIVLCVAVALVCWFLLSRTAFGRYVYAIGGNEEAARLSGVRVGRVKVAAFALCGACASLAGIVAASRAGTGQTGVGVGMELSAIAAVVIGGTSILGGEGAIWRTILGVFLLALINNAFNILDVPTYYRDLVTGALILVAVSVNSLATSGRRR